MVRILGVSPGTRGIGLAVLSDSKAIGWRIKTYPEKWSQEKLRVMVQYIAEYAEHNHVEAVAIKLPNELPVSVAYIQLVGSLNVLFGRMGLPVYYYSLNELKLHHCGTNRSNKKNLADCMTTRYPHLISALHKEKNNRNAYYMKIFEAIAAADYLRTRTE